MIKMKSIRMTAEETARKLISSFRSGKVMFPLMEQRHAVQCAIVCCDQAMEVLGQSREDMLKNIHGVIGIDAYFSDELQFWIEVKKQIENS